MRKVIATAAIGFAALVGLIPAQSDFIGITSNSGAKIGIRRVPDGALIPLDNSLRIELDLDITGWRNVQGCVGGDTPPNCTYRFNRPATGNPCDFRTDRLTDYYQGPCDLLGMSITIHWWMSAGDGTWNNPVRLPDTRIVPRLRDPAHCQYDAIGRARLALPECTRPQPTPTAPPIACPPGYVAVPCPTPPPGYTPVPWLCCSTGSNCYWGYYPTCGCYNVVCCNQYSCLSAEDRQMQPEWLWDGVNLIPR